MSCLPPFCKASSSELAMLWFSGGSSGEYFTPEQPI